jgi:hypothetical protein
MNNPYIYRGQDQAPNPAPVQNLELGSVISRSIDLVRENPVVFLGLAALCLIPSMLIELLLPAGSAVSVLASLLDSILTVVAQGAVAYAVFQMFVSYKASIGESISRGMNRIWPLIAIAILTSIAIGLGLILLIVPGIILFLMWCVAVPACVVEKLGPIESLGRSVELTRGYKGTIFLIYLLFILVLIVIAVVLAVIAGLVLGEKLATVVMSVAMIFPMAFINVTGAVIYYDLRAIKEGVSAESIASVFE